MRNRELAKQLLADFDKSRNLIKVNINEKEVSEQRQIKRGYTEKKTAPKKTDFYSRYKKKLDEEDFEKFNARDMWYFFKDTAENAGYKFIDNNMTVSMRNLKLCVTRGYEVIEVLNMIAFIYESEQDYLDKRDVKPSILISNWGSTIYKDTLDWLDDKYTPNSKKSNKHKNTRNREWKEPIDTSNTQIGEWD